MIDGLVSVITPLYNSEKFIKETMQSVLNQTYENWEMLIVDDVSTDKSLNIVKEFTKQDGRIKLFQMDKNSGPANCRNKAIKEAKGEYIAFLDSDDLWKENKLEEQISFMNENKIFVCCSSYEIIDEQGKQKNIKIKMPKKPITIFKFLLTTPIGCLTGIYNAKHLGKMYFPQVEKREDAAFWINMLKIVKIIYPIHESLAYYRVHQSSISSNKLNLIKYQWNLYRNYAKLGIFFSAICVVSIVLVKLFKIKEQKI